jgi:hypothetical protein
MDQLIDEPCYLNLKPETSNIFFKLMEEVTLPFPNPLASVESSCRNGVERRIEPRPAEGYALYCNEPTSEDSFSKG